MKRYVYCMIFFSDLYKRDTKVVFGYRSYKLLLPLIFLSGLFWIPTRLKMFDYVISVGGDQVRRRFPMFDFERLLLPKWFKDVRTYAALFSVLSIVDARRIWVKNQKIRDRNLDAITNKGLKHGYLETWRTFKNTDDDEQRKRIKIDHIIEMYTQHVEPVVAKLSPKDIEFFSDGRVYEFPSLNLLERVLKSEKKDHEGQMDRLHQFDEDDLFSFHTLILASIDCKERPLVSYGRPLGFAAIALTISLFYALSRYNVVKFSFGSSRRSNF